MIYKYDDCVIKYGSDYQLKLALKEKKAFFVEKGIYSDSEYYHSLDVISKKYPNAVFAGKSAFFYHDLTDSIPDKYCLATKREDTRFKDERVSQQYIKAEYFDLGITTLDVNGSTIRIYDKERMLIELMRFGKKYPLDYYKEIVNSYRDIVYKLDFGKTEKYAKAFPNGENILRKIQLEVL